MNVVLKAGKKTDRARSQLKIDKKKNAKSYLSEVREEIKKISWPQVDELKMCTKVVIGATFIFGLGIYISDLVIKGVLDSVSILCRVVLG